MPSSSLCLPLRRWRESTPGWEEGGTARTVRDSPGPMAPSGVTKTFKTRRMETVSRQGRAGSLQVAMKRKHLSVNTELGTSR